jgi:hypothetical protein
MADYKNYIIVILLTAIAVSGVSFYGYRESKNRTIKEFSDQILKLSEIPKNAITIKEETSIGKLKKGGTLNQDKDNKAKIEDKSKNNKK